MCSTVYSRFKSIADAAPDRPAVIDEQYCVNYLGLDRLVDTLISRFPTFVPARVGVVLDHGVEMIATILAVIKCGGAFVAVEPDCPKERTRAYLIENGVDFVVTQKEYAASLNDDFRLLILDKGIHVDTTMHPLPDRSMPERPAYILYTSTPDGFPLGVAVSNEAAVNSAIRFGRRFKITDDDILLQFSACILNLFIQEVFGALLNGATLAIPSAATKGDVDKLVKYIDDNYVTVIQGFPFLMMELNGLKTVPPTVRLLISGGDNLSRGAVDNLVSQVTVYNTYGLPETVSSVCAQLCDTDSTLPDGTFPVGKPADDGGVRILLLDDELQPVEPGESGEICIAGDILAEYYTGDHRNEMTGEFTTLPDGERVLRTGDIGRLLPDGSLAYLHRKDFEVNILGQKVITSQVERAMLRSDEVKDCVVVHYADADGSAYLVAYVVPADQSFRLSWVKNKMAQYLPPYMIPEYFVLLKALPLDVYGKVNHDALPIVLKDDKAV